MVRTPVQEKSVHRQLKPALSLKTNKQRKLLPIIQVQVNAETTLQTQSCSCSSIVTFSRSRAPWIRQPWSIKVSNKHFLLWAGGCQCLLLASPVACSCDALVSPLTVQIMLKPPRWGRHAYPACKTDEMALKTYAYLPRAYCSTWNIFFLVLLFAGFFWRCFYFLVKIF